MNAVREGVSCIEWLDGSHRCKMCLGSATICPLGNKDKAEALYKDISTYNFNGIDYALIRNEVVNRKPAM